MKLLEENRGNAHDMEMNKHFSDQTTEAQETKKKKAK